jgi:general secretion pathway protein N
MSTQGAKLLSLILAAFCGVLLVLALALQTFGLGRGYTWLAPEADTGAGDGAAVIDRTPFKLPAEEQFAATQARPVFNEDRKPTPDEPGDDSSTPQPPSAPLNIALTGVVLTPELRLAMVQDKGKNSSVALKEGMPMPGDQGGWTLTRINQRSVIFREVSGDEIEVELTTAVANPKPNAPAHPTTAANAPAHPTTTAAAGTPVLPRVAPNQTMSALNPLAGTSAANPQQEALQHRIEERRKQMRDEAERQKQQQPAQPQPQQHMPQHE